MATQRLLYLDIHSARNLIACDASKGSSNPYLVVSLLDIANRPIKNEKQNSTVRERSLNPKYEQKLTLGRHYDLNNTSALPSVLIQVFHKSFATLVGTDQPMGEIDIPLINIKGDGSSVTEWYRLRKFGRMRDVTGEVHVTIRFSGPPPGERGVDGTIAPVITTRETFLDSRFSMGPLDEHRDAKPNELHVMCIAGRGLPAMDSSLFGRATSDPLIKARVDTLLLQTKHIPKTLEPQWNEELVFPGVTDPALSLQITVEDHDFTKNDFMGRVIIPLYPFENMLPVKRWYKLNNNQGVADGVNRGEVELAIVWQFNPAIREKPSSGFLSQMNQMGKSVRGFVLNESDEEVEDTEEGEEPGEIETHISPDEAAKLQKEKEEAEAALKKELGEIEVKSGDYQVQVHIIECRELAAKDFNKSSDPIVYIEAFDQTQNTSVQPACLSCVYDELFIFNFRNMDKDVFSEGLIKIRVMDANVLMKNVLIGSYVFDAARIYYQKDHEMYRKWVAIINDEDSECTGVQGYVKLSVQIIGPGDKLKIHDEEEEMRKEREAMMRSGGDISSLVLMPPSIKKEWKFIVTTIYRAEYLPVMDQNAVQVGALGIRNGTDAFCQVEFSGGKPKKTKPKTLKGQRAAMNPQFNDEIWYPISVPTATQSIKFSVWDHNITGSTLIATAYTKYGIISKIQRPEPFWINLYGAPVANGFAMTTTMKGGLNKLKSLAEREVDYTALYNTYPERGSCYKGRVLISQTIRNPEDRPSRFRKNEIEAFRIKIKKKKPDPPMATYVLRALVVSGTELPDLFDPKGVALLKKQKLQIQVAMGPYELYTQRVDCVRGVCEWAEYLHQEVEFPVDQTQIPDIGVYLCRGKDAEFQPICFARFKASQLLNEEFKAPPQWIFLKEDKSIDALSSGEFPGSVLIRVGFGLKETAEVTEMEWEKSIQQMKKRSSYQVRCHLYQGKDFPAADANGLLDPFIRIKLLGEVKESEKKSKTRFPLYYQTLTFDCELPEHEEYLPQVNLQLYDTDMVVRSEYMGQCFVPLTDSFHHLKETDSSSQFPDPKFYELFKEIPGDGQGEILVSFQLLKKTRPDEILAQLPDIKPSTRQAWIEVIAVGIRNMKPYKFQSMMSPYLEMEMECVDKKVTMETEPSKRPTPDDPNFLQRLVMPVMLPDNALFAPPLALRARDLRLGGYLKPEVGVGSVDLLNKIPWSKTYRPPQSDIFYHNDMNMAAGFMTSLTSSGNGNDGFEEKQSGELDHIHHSSRRLLQKRQNDKEADAMILTQAPADVEGYIMQRINENDIGAGVFGALTHLKLPEYAGKRKRVAEDYFAEIDFAEDEKEEPPKYLINRRVLPEELEEELKTTPFESYGLYRGQKNHPLFGNTIKMVGKFKGLVRVMLSPDEPALFDLATLLKPQGYKIRLYALRGLNLTPMDMGFGGRPGKSDPYLKVRLGKEKFNDRENAVDDATDVDFYQLIEFNAELPGYSQLVINVMDKDDIGSDDLIGSTTIDLEDRWFDKRWQELGRENRDDNPETIRWDTKPIERRSLYVPSSNNGQGVLECWVDILTPPEATAFPPDDVSLPPRQMFEVRVVIWKSRDVPAQDTFGGQNMTDLFIKSWPDGCKEQETDTHWRSKKGKASFNWRMVFELELGHGTRAMKFPYFHLQSWDRDVIKWNDMIAETTVDLGFYYRKAFKKNMAIKLYETPKGRAARSQGLGFGSGGAEGAKGKEKKYESKQVKIKDTERDLPPPPDTEEDSDDEVMEESDDLGGSIGGSGIAMKKMKSQQKKKLMTAAGSSSSAATASAQSPAAAGEGDGTAPSWKTRFFSLFQRGSDSDDEPEVEEDELPEEPPRDPEDEEQDALINQVKEMTGLWEIDPEDSTWLHLDCLDHETGIREPMGRVCYSMQLWPQDKAMIMKVGTGRSAPNQDPFLPPPTGRLQFSWNPFYMCIQICGPSLCAKVICCVICLGVLALMVFCQPALNILIALFLY